MDEAIECSGRVRGSMWLDAIALAPGIGRNQSLPEGATGRLGVTPGIVFSVTYPVLTSATRSV